MTDTTTSPEAAASTNKSATSIWTDLGPVILFVAVYNIKQRMGLPEDPTQEQKLLASVDAMYWATGVFMAATLGVIGWMLSQGKKPTPMLLLTTGIVTVFGTLTFIFQDLQFIYHKPTIINLLFAGLIFGGLAVGKNVWKIAFQHAFELPDEAWKVFAIRWGLFYIFLAAVNELILYFFTGTPAYTDMDFWVSSKLFITMPLTIVFMLANLPYLMKFMPQEEEAESS